MVAVEVAGNQGAAEVGVGSQPTLQAGTLPTPGLRASRREAVGLAVQHKDCTRAPAARHTDSEVVSIVTIKIAGRDGITEPVALGGPAPDPRTVQTPGLRPDQREAVRRSVQDRHASLPKSLLGHTGIRHHQIREAIAIEVAVAQGATESIRPGGSTHVQARPLLAAGRREPSRRPVQDLNQTTSRSGRVPMNRHTLGYCQVRVPITVEIGPRPRRRIRTAH